MKNAINTLFSPDNDFFNLTKDSKRLTHISLSSFILPVIFLILAGLIAKFIFAPLILGDPTQYTSAIREAFQLYFMFGTAILLIFLWVKYFEGRPIYTLGFTKNNALNKYLSGFGTGILLNSVVIGLMAVFGTIEISSENSFSLDINGWMMIILFLFGFVIQGASEEILTRGWMFQVIGARYKPWIGVVITSLFFSLVHLGNAGINFIAVANIVLIALLFTLYVMRDGNLWFVCGWHSAWNWSLGNVFGLSVSGHNEVTSIVDLNTTGNVIFSGGDFGPEGSIVATSVFLIAIVMVSAKIIRMEKEKIILKTITDVVEISEVKE